MSEVMLHGVLNMPIDIWGDDHLDKIQRHYRYVEASELIRSQDAEINQLRQKLEAAEAETQKLRLELITSFGETQSALEKLEASQKTIREALEHIAVLIEIGQLGFSEIQEPEHDEIFNQIKSAENFLLDAPVPAMPIQDDKEYAIDPRYPNDNGDYYLLGSDIKEILFKFEVKPSC